MSSLGMIFGFRAMLPATISLGSIARWPLHEPLLLRFGLAPSLTLVTGTRIRTGATVTSTVELALALLGPCPTVRSVVTLLLIPSLT